MSLPSGYKRLEYIQSSGKQYIDTGFKQNQNSRVVMHVKPVSITANSWAFEGRTSSDCRKGVFFYYSSGKLWNADYYDSNGRKSFSGISSTADLNIDYDKNTCTVNGVSVNFTAKTFQSTFNLTLLACNTGGTVAGYLSAKLYACQIYDNGSLVRDYIPCQTTSGEIGLWDNVNSVFYGNAGTGTFTAGPVVAVIPDPPSNLHQTMSVRLVWAEVSNAEWYNIYRDGTLIASTTDLFFVDDTAAENTEYTYGISAANSAGESPKTTIPIYTKSGYFLYKPYVESATFQ